MNISNNYTEFYCPNRSLLIWKSCKHIEHSEDNLEEYAILPDGCTLTVQYNGRLEKVFLVAGDYIIKSKNGNYHHTTPETFNQSYKTVE